ncbi:MAG: hypothetical protein ACYSVY_22300 [Planctomycetota bacterium]|jgi:hypothetical protein
MTSNYVALKADMIARVRREAAPNRTVTVRGRPSGGWTVDVVPASTVPATTRKVELRPFTQHDWHGWAGCTPPSTGGEPLIGCGEADAAGRWGDDTPACATVLVDATGIGVHMIPEDPSIWDDDVWYFLDDPNFTRAAVVAGAIETPVRAAQLEALGLTEQEW